MEDKAITQAMIRQIVARTKCSLCHCYFRAGDARVIGRRENAWALRVTCRECGAQVLLLAVLGDSAKSVHTDLLPEEWNRFKDRPAISDDDVIQFYEYMEAYDGDWSDVLEDPLPSEK